MSKGFWSLMDFFATFSYSCNLIIKFLAKKFINEKKGNRSFLAFDRKPSIFKIGCLNCEPQHR